VFSRKSICRTVHRASVLRRIRSLLILRTQKADPLHVAYRSKDALGAYASSRQDTDYTGGGVVRSFDPGAVTRGTACLTSVCIQAVLKAVIYGQAGRLVETTFSGYRGV
jgi:hypothetical protein